MGTKRCTKTKVANRVAFVGNATECKDCGKFIVNMSQHLERCPQRLRLCGRCGRDVKGGSLICDRCDEGGAHIDEQRDRQTLDVFCQDIDIIEEDEEREEYYGL